MKYCTGCGAKLDEDAKFCTVCGTPTGGASASGMISAESSPRNNSGKKIPIWLVIALAAAVLLGGAGYAAISGGLFTSAPAQFVEKTDEFVEPVVEAAAKVVTGDRSLLASKDSSVNTDVIISGSFPSTGLGEVDELIKDASVTFQVNSQTGKDTLLGLKLNLSGSDVLTGFFKVGSESLGLCFPELDDSYYSVDYKELPSIFEAFGINSDELEMVAGATEGIGASMVDMDTEEVENVLSKYFDILYSVITKDNTKRENTTYRYDVLDGEVKCALITFEPTEDDIEKAVTEFAETLQDDDDLRDIVEALVEKLNPGNADSIMDDYDSTLKDLDNDIDDIIDNLSEMELVFSIACKGERVYAFKVLDCDGNGIGYESCGASLKERSDAIIAYTDEDASEVAVNSYELHGTKIVGELECNEELLGSDISAEYELSLKDRSALRIPYGEYTIKANGNKYSVSVGSEDEGSLHEISFKLNGEKIVLNILSTDEDSTVKEPSEEPEEITSDNIQDILSSMADKALEIFYNFYG